jgi:exodeoxyribonuclease V beta subunit
LFLVGDPKQAIYSFRGADIFAYLQARQEAPRRHTLLENWRSTPGVIAGCNALFGGTAQPFLFDGIDFQPALAAPKPRAELRDPEGGPAAFRIWFLEGEGDKPLGKEKAREQITAALAQEIARLLAGARADQVLLDGRPLQARQIAVLVRSHGQGEQVREALRGVGIHSVQRSRADVFDSREAAELELVLRALAWPGREGLLRTALATELLGWDGDALHALGEQEALLEAQVESCRELHRQWQEGGFSRVFRRLLRERGVAERLLALRDGERRLTNLLHLGELLHLQDGSAHPGVEGLVKWLALRRQGAGEGPAEEAQLRLESDEDLVQIVTIHKSKGLQYPVVFCPFLWDGKLWSAGLKPGDGEYRFHAQGEGDKPRSVLELGSAGFAEGLPLAQREELAENLRLLYVAITRAEQRCYLAWGHIKEAGSSPLGWLLHPGDGLSADWVKRAQEAVDELGTAGLSKRLNQLVQDSGEAIQVQTLAAEPAAATAFRDAQATGPAGLTARSFQGRIRPSGRITSFTALAAQGLEAERPDHDSLRDDKAVPSPTPAPVAAPALASRDIFGFPRGSQAGSCLHAVFERIDFTRATPEVLGPVVTQALTEFGFDPGWTPVVCDMVAEVLALPLDGRDLRLGRIGPGQRLVELEFTYPLASLKDRELRRLLRVWLGDQGPLAAAAGRVRFGEAQGFMKGFIDLVFEQDGVFYLADYKSNHLGPDLQDYAAERLTPAIAGEGYFLQYLFYTLALHRYLQSRLPDYDYDRHFGGCYYLFLRGMRADLGPGHGVFFDRPPRGVIDGLDTLI